MEGKTSQVHQSLYGGISKKSSVDKKPNLHSDVNVEQNEYMADCSSDSEGSEEEDSPKFIFQSWCPRTLGERENRSFHYDKPDHLNNVINHPNFTNSLKETYGKSFDSEDDDDRLLMRAKKPRYKKMERTLCLNFNGRVKMSSRKNI
jgi:hypothetical protein